MKKTAFIIVDLQNDFISGSLAVKGAEEIVPLINKELLSRNYDLVVSTLDYHPKDHLSFASNNGKEVGSIGELGGLPQVMWPDHCVIGTWGAAYHKDLLIEKIQREVKKGQNKNIDSYSGFLDNDGRTETGLNKLLKEEGITDVVICGLALDYCVKATALHAKELGYKTIVKVSLTRSVNLNKGDDQKTLKELMGAGVILYS